MTPAIPHADITGLVVCGGRGMRLGGVDKGLQLHQGQPLALHALRRLQPQVGPLMINANRNLQAYAALGVPVWPDELPDYPGPLAGWLAGLAQCRTPYLATVPCDTPGFPVDLVAQLALELAAQGSDIAMAVTREDGRLQAQPVFCLMKAGLRARLQAYLQTGQRQIERWVRQQNFTSVVFDDAPAFFNANTADDLRLLAGVGLSKVDE